MLFEPYRFDNLETDESIFIDGWSYLWAAIAGPIYLLAKGFFREAVVMIAISALLAVAAAISLVMVVGLIDGIAVTIVAATATPIIAMTAQSVIAVQLLRAALISRGWREGY